MDRINYFEEKVEVYWVCADVGDATVDVVVSGELVDFYFPLVEALGKWVGSDNCHDIIRRVHMRRHLPILRNLNPISRIILESLILIPNPKALTRLDQPKERQLIFYSVQRVPSFRFQVKLVVIQVFNNMRE